MNETVKKLLTAALMLAVLVYTFVNYANGKTDLTFLVVACLIIGYPMVVIVSSLIQDLKKK